MGGIPTEGSAGSAIGATIACFKASQELSIPKCGNWVVFWRSFLAVWVH